MNILSTREKFQNYMAMCFINILFRELNHFQYYIDTEGLFENASNICVEKEENISKIDKWLEEVREKIKNENRIHFDIIICPEHYSNSGFVKRVNNVVFGGASLVVSINSSKEYRDNCKNKTQ